MSIDNLRRINSFETVANMLTLICVLILLLSIVVVLLPEIKCKRVFMWVWVTALLLPILAQFSHALYARSAGDGIRIQAKALWQVPQDKISARTILELDRASSSLISGGADGGLLPPNVILRQIEGLEFIGDSIDGNGSPRIWLMNAQIEYLHLGFRRVGTIKPHPGKGLWIGEIEGVPANQLDAVIVGDHP